MLSRELFTFLHEKLSHDEYVSMPVSTCNDMMKMKPFIANDVFPWRKGMV